MVVNTKDPWSAFGGFITPGELKSDYLEPGWVQCEVSKNYYVVMNAQQGLFR